MDWMGFTIECPNQIREAIKSLNDIAQENWMTDGQTTGTHSRHMDRLFEGNGVGRQMSRHAL